jgi:fucose permease
MKAASALHYATMAAIALSAILLGFLADRIGRKPTIVIGLSLFAVNSYLFVLGNSFGYFLLLLVVSGTAIGIFKSGALALIGDISTSTTQHTATMNLIEGFFGVGAIIGPAIVTALIHAGVSWKWLYSIAGTICLVLLLIALLVRYPPTLRSIEEPVNLARTLRMMRNPFALAFGGAACLYVAVEAAVYVWAPTYLAGYHGSFFALASYAVSVFFVLRAAGRFLGAWLLSRFDWSRALALLSLAILLCLAGSALGSLRLAVVLLPLSGLFMSVVYPTLNSKGISCFPKAEHGAVAGVILFFTCLGAVLGPLAMAALIDATGQPRNAFVLAAGFAALLFVGLAWNWLRQPARAVLSQWDAREYGARA